MAIPKRRRMKRNETRYKRVPKPRCPVHGCDMLVYSVHLNVRYVACPVQDCQQTAKQTREPIE